jgi:hypothetical protein
MSLLLSLPPEILLHHILSPSPSPSTFPLLSPIDISSFSQTCKYSFSLIYNRQPFASQQVEEEEEGLKRSDGPFWKDLFLNWFDDPKEAWDWYVQRVFSDRLRGIKKLEFSWNWKVALIERVETIKYVRMGEGDERKVRSFEVEVQTVFVSSSRFVRLLSRESSCNI